MPGRPLSRRTTLGSALMAPLVLAACDIDPPRRADGTSTPTPEPPEDSELVSDVVTAIVIAQGVLDAAVRSVPDLASRLDPVRAAHAEHLDLLVGAVPEADLPTGGLATVPPRAAVALRQVSRSEQRLLRVVREGCLESRSGDLARVLASVAASTSQHLAALAVGTAP